MGEDEIQLPLDKLDQVTKGSDAGMGETMPMEEFGKFFEVSYLLYKIIVVCQFFKVSSKYRNSAYSTFSWSSKILYT